MAASELKSNISNANFTKNKKWLFLYFDTSQTNQTDSFLFIHCSHQQKFKEDLGEEMLI